MQPEIQNLLGQSLVLMLVAGVCLLACLLYTSPSPRD